VEATVERKEPIPVINPAPTVDQGSLAHTILLYTVSEPGEWTAGSISEDLSDMQLAAVERAAQRLHRDGFIHINSSDHHLWPRRPGRAVIHA
jgi:hypothetical protein